MGSAVDNCTWRDIVAEKRRQQQEAIIAYAKPVVPNTITETNGDTSTSFNRKKCNLITEIDDTVELASLIAKGQLKSEDVTREYIARYDVHRWWPM